MSDIYFKDDEVFFEEQGESSIEEDHSKVNEEIEKYKRSHNQVPKHSLTDIKSSHKNKIINKIRDIAPETELKSLSKINASYSEQPKGFVDKRERNKFSAKQSRDRKKLYIEIMEQKQKKMQQELTNKRKQLQETKNYLQKVINQNQTMSSFTAGRHQMIKKLQHLLERSLQEDVNLQINEVIDSLRYRIGATGRERINTINEYFRQIVNLSLPALHRYMMWSAAEGKHLFSRQDIQNDDWYQDLKDSLNLSEQQHRDIRLNQGKFIEQKQLLGKLIDGLKEIKSRIESKSVELEDMIDSIREILTPSQSAQFILFIERNKYRKELNLCDIGEDEAIRKQLKKQ